MNKKETQLDMIDIFDGLFLYGTIALVVSLMIFLCYTFGGYGIIASIFVGLIFLINPLGVAFVLWGIILVVVLFKIGFFSI